MRRWVSSSLNRKVMLAAGGGLVLASAVFLVLFVSVYRSQLAQERSRASVQVNHLLQASLENAMLKRDLEGLRDIVTRLGAQDDIRQVMIVNPADEVRFASSPGLLGRRFARASDPACRECHGDVGPATATTAFTTNEQGDAVLRSVNPVRNKEPCTECHGDRETNPVNGVLFVDYDAAPIREQALASALALSGSGTLVTLLAMVGVWWAMRRFVVAPVSRLAAASRALAAGRLDARVNLQGQDELAQLAHSFNDMAENLQTSLQTVRDNEAFLQSLIDAVPDGIRLIADDFTILKANRAYCEQLGTTMEATVGVRCYRSSHGRSEPCPATLVRCPVKEMLAGGRGMLRTFHQHVREDQSDCLVEVFAAPVRITIDGRPRDLIVESIRDLSRSVQYSHEQRLAELGQLAAGVAHEVHNPLASIRLSVQTILRHRTPGDQLDVEQLQHYLATVDHEIDSCIEVTERLLKLSVPPGARAELVDLNEAIRETLSLLAHEAEARAVVVDLDLGSTPLRVLASESDLRMVVLNLAQNAFHAMPEGGHLRITTEEVRDEIRAGFEDSGVGIRPQDISHIYEPFFSHRADGVRGTGLGLSICKTIVERHGGRIEVRTRLGKGTRFVITLPSAAERASASRRRANA